MKITEIYTTSIETAKKDFIERIEEIKNSELVAANKEKGIYQMRSKKGIFLTRINPDDIKNTCNKETEFGFVVKCDDEFTEENIEKTKEIVCDKMCALVRELIMNVPEKFFVIRNSVPMGIIDEQGNESIEYKKLSQNGVDYFTVGCNMILPLPFTKEEFEEITK